MAVRLVILGTETRHYHIRPKFPDDPHDVSKNFVVIPDVQRLISRLREPEVVRSREELLRVVDASRIEQFLRSNDAEALAQFGSQYILTPIATRNAKISGIVKRTVRPERHQICVFVVRVRRDVQHAAKDIELL